MKENNIMLCPCCIEEHEITSVVMHDTNIINGTAVCFDAHYNYCPATSEYYATEEQMRINDIAQKDAYRRAKNMLTSDDIKAILTDYGISQNDFCTVLGWGEKTITRYMTHQLQDSAHDEILKKISSDPEWFLALLNGAREKLKPELYEKYKKKAIERYSKLSQKYQQNAILSEQASYGEENINHGYTKIDLMKVVEVVNYFAASKGVRGLYLVKLMKMIWYGDFLCFKHSGHSITGLAYQHKAMGALPFAYKKIIDLNGIHYVEKIINDNYACNFIADENFTPQRLTEAEISVLDMVIKRFGTADTATIVNAMHEERAYKETSSDEVIPYSFAEFLTLE